MKNVLQFIFVNISRKRHLR